MSGPRYLCVHGHFYQPPRENPWLEAIESQDSAYPYHDWNERITAECYAPNAAARILDEQDRILRIVNNYANISFNFGPTLASYLETDAPEVYEAILQADRESRAHNSGHGSALGQAYSHSILPLATRRDKVTQVHWGIRDFESRFGRRPAGLWLPETAVDLETLEVLAEAGIRFTILAQGQAARVRDKGTDAWQDVGGGRIDPRVAYEQALPSGRSIALFFYDGSVSHEVAFGRLLDRGDRFARHMLDRFDDREGPQLVHIATDGETYGHHHGFGEMALAFALDHVESRGGVQTINYGAFLERHPPVHDVEIQENTSWSCSHGVERWRKDCGCATGAHPGWSQAWRAPLRAAMDGLRDRMGLLFEERAGRLLKDPWQAREDYIELVLDRSENSRDRFLARQALRPLTEEERVEVWKLLELQRHVMLSSTSCGWFFDDLAGIETVQVMQYAGRALQLSREVTGEEAEHEFLSVLDEASSNSPRRGSGRDLYHDQVAPAVVDLLKVGAHYATSLLFRSYEGRDRVHGYVVEQEEHRLQETGTARLATGRVRVVSTITEEEARLAFAVLHFGDHNLTGGVREFRDEAAHQEMITMLEATFDGADLPSVVRILDVHFERTFTLKSLFRDEQRRILKGLLRTTLDEAGVVFRQFYDRHVALMRFLGDLNIPLPDPLRAAGECVLNDDLRTALEADAPDLDRVRRLIDEAGHEKVALDLPGLGLAMQNAMAREMEGLDSDHGNVDRLTRLVRGTRLVRTIPLEANLWKVENGFYGLLQNRYPQYRARAEEGDGPAREWVRRFLDLGKALKIRVDADGDVPG